FECSGDITKAFCREVRCAVAEEREQPEITLVAIIILPDSAASDAIRIRRTDENPIGSPVDIGKRCSTVGSDLRTLDVVSDQYQRQLAEADINIFVASVPSVHELVPDFIELGRVVEQIEVVMIRAYPGQIQIAGTQVDIIDAHAKP